MKQAPFVKRRGLRAIALGLSCLATCFSPACAGPAVPEATRGSGAGVPDGSARDHLAPDGATPTDGGALDGPAGDGSPDGSVSPRACDDRGLRFSQSDAEVAAAIDALAAGIRATGSPGTLDPPPSGLQPAYFKDLLVDLPVPVTSDPRPAILEWLASVPGSPVEPDEYAPNPERPSDFPTGGFLAGFVRTRSAPPPSRTCPSRASLR